MAVLFGVLTAISYGAADFCGGLGAKRAATQTVVALSQLVGLLGAVVLGFAFAADHLAGRDLWLGAGVGAVGIVGLVLLYRGLACGRMSVIAPVTAVGSATLPVLWGLATGERPSALALAGVVAAMVAVVLVARGPSGDGATDGDIRTDLLLAAGAGVSFGIGLVLLGETGSDAGMWPLVSARATSVLLLGLAAAVTRRAPIPPRGAGGIIALTGVLDISANAFYLAGVHTGLVSLVGVLAAMYPVSTVVLATLVLDEQLSRYQVAGLALAAGGAALIVAG